MTRMSSSKVAAMATFDHLDLFDKMKLKSWIENLDFFLQQENIYYVLSEPCPKGPKHAGRDGEMEKRIAKWKDDDCLCRNFILKTMFNPQLCVQSKTAKDLWETLKTAYIEEMKQESWRELRMDFFMRQKDIAYVLVEPCPDAEHILSDQGTPQDINDKIRKWKEDDYSCRNLILQEAVVPQFAKHATAKQLRDTLKSFYMTEEPSIIAENNREMIRLRREVVHIHYEETITSLTERTAEGDKEMTRLMQKVIEMEEEIARQREEFSQKGGEETIKELEKKVISGEEEITRVKQEQEKKQNQDYQEIERLKVNVAKGEEEIKRLKENVSGRLELDGSDNERIRKLKREVKRRNEEVKMLRCAWKQMDEVMIKMFSQQNLEEENDDCDGVEVVKFDESDDDDDSEFIEFS